MPLCTQDLPLLNPPVLDMMVTYDADTNRVMLEALAGDYTYLLSLVQDPILKTFGVTVPAPAEVVPPSGAPVTSSVRLVYDKALAELSVGLSGSWTAATIAKRMGLEWPLADDILTITAPTITYTSVPTAFGASLTVDIPVLRVTSMASSLQVQGGGQMSLLVSEPLGPCVR